MQPYQEASKEIRRQSDIPANTLKTAGVLGASALGGGAIIGRVLPLLSRLIPADLAIKGLSKVDPRIGKFIDSSLKLGNTFDDIRDFIQNKAQEGSGNAKDNRNVIQQYSPELHEFLSGEIGKGRSALEAGSLAESNPSFKNIIKKLSEDHKAPFSSILQTVYGDTQGDGKTQALQKFQEHQKKTKQPSPLSRESLMEQAQQNRPQQDTNVDDAILQALDKILKM